MPYLVLLAACVLAIRFRLRAGRVSFTAPARRRYVRGHGVVSEVSVEDLRVSKMVNVAGWAMLALGALQYLSRFVP